ncbi:hypothetical protein GH714_011455 [Hevea brasiliensis]|uniref:Protein FAR1-RELATED SEQUENCE n=1 Tax=Hevea brasiliensis TaxID=3981 RepID=A0A6A6MMW0_HEVBR|nr:hypothetical protein GH714_011455 [Hevea brasiliensis]
MSKFMRVHRSIPLAIKRRLEAHDIARIRPSRSVRLLEVQAGGPEKLSCLPRDRRNFNDISRRWKLGNGDADYINRMFLRMQQQNTNIFYLIDTDEDQRFTNVFWVHLWSIAAYEEFCDVVPEKLRGVQEYDKAKKEFIALMYDSLSPIMFERNWHEFVMKYNLEGNEWLLKLYNERQFWVPVHVNHIFWAGMLLTQRSEGMHAYFDGYVNSMSTLKQFIEQYEIALRDKVEKEFFADFRSKNTDMNCISDFQWERQFQEAYTTGMYKQVQNEIKQIWDCNVHQSAPGKDINEGDEEFVEPGFEQHKILERSLLNDWYMKEHVYTVLYNEEGSVFKWN